MAGSVVWIGLVAVLLAGVVAVNVAVLRLNVRLDHVSRERAQLRADNAALEAQAAAAAGSLGIEQKAEKLGFVPAESANATFVTLPPR